MDKLAIEVNTEFKINLPDSIQNTFFIKSTDTEISFEKVICRLANLKLVDTHINFLLQRDLNILIKANELANEPRDIAWLEKKIKSDTFDLYVINIKDGKTYCVGCCQCKTSIRDRVTRDREPSIEAMKCFFWSIAFVLDGTMLNVPKYIDMVNGNPNSDYAKNGWHGLYDLSSSKNNDRIYALDINFDILRNHTIKAVEYWHTQRQWFNQDWRAGIRKDNGLTKIGVRINNN